MEKVSYLGLDNCLRLSNDRFEAVVSTDVGPRVLRYAEIGGTNALGEFPEKGATTEYGDWRIFGGHRLWAAPEAMPFSYAPDNVPLDYRMEGNFSVRLIAPTDAAGLAKEMAVTIDLEGSGLHVRHRITNRSGSALEIAPWALTVFSGGTAILPLEPFRAHGDALLPSQPMVLWPFTDLGDPRLRLGGQWIRFSSDANREQQIKIGLANKQGWAAHANGALLFLKRFPYLEGANYPDYGVNTELFTSGGFLEVESLAPLVRLEEGQSVDHVEKWQLWTGVSDEEIEKKLTELRGW